jgi:hypothetical protein
LASNSFHQIITNWFNLICQQAFTAVPSTIFHISFGICLLLAKFELSNIVKLCHEEDWQQAFKICELVESFH